MATTNPIEDLECVALVLCRPCLNGKGGECHSPGCALYMNRAPDVPILLIGGLKAENADA